MVSAIYQIELERGVKVDLLFTPRLYMFKGIEGITFEYESVDTFAMMSLYADIMYCAARNHWTLTHKASDAFPYTRLKFHAFMADKEAFHACMLHAMQALSGKSLEELKAGGDNTGEAVKKK